MSRDILSFFIYCHTRYFSGRLSLNIINIYHYNQYDIEYNVLEYLIEKTQKSSFQEDLKSIERSLAVRQTVTGD